MAAPAGAERQLPELPDLVLLKVLELLPLRDRLRAARVCRRWRRLALDRAGWKRLDLSPYRVTSRTLWTLLRRHLLAAVRSLQLAGPLLTGRRQRPPPLSPALLSALGKRCPQLCHLSLAQIDLNPLPSSCIPPNLVSLELRSCEMPSGWFSSGALPRLRRLVVANVAAFSDHHLLAVASRCQLQTLSLTGTYRVTSAGIQKALSSLEELQELILRSCCQLGDATLSSLLLRANQLRSLDLAHSFCFTDQSLAQLASLQALQVLSVDLGKETSPGALLALCQALPSLKKLSLGGAELGAEVLEQVQASLPHCSFTTTT